MEPVLDSCAGMDVHEKKVDVCIAHGPLEKSPKFEIRTFSTMTSEKNRLTKLLESSNIKLSSVVSKISGVSSMAMIRSLLENDRLFKEEISQLAKGSLKKKVNLLEKALDGKLTDHHRFLLKMHMENLDHLARQIEKIDEQIERKMIPFQKESNLIQSIPGISKVSASAILAEIGCLKGQTLNL